MAIYGRKEAKMGAKASLDKAYLKYYSGMRSKNKQPMTRYHWERSGRRSGYYGTKGSTMATAKLKRSERKRVGMKD